MGNQLDCCTSKEQATAVEAKGLTYNDKKKKGKTLQAARQDHHDSISNKSTDPELVKEPSKELPRECPFKIDHYPATQQVKVVEETKEEVIQPSVEQAQGEMAPATQETQDPSTLDNMEAFFWNGPEDEDEEVPELVELKTEWEREEGIRFSKKGIMDAVEAILLNESPESEDARTASKWEQKLKTRSLTYYLKKGGSDVNKSQPFFRSDITFNKAFKMDKVIKCIWDPEHQKKWDVNLQEASFTPLREGVSSYGFTYCQNKKQFTIQSRDFYEKGFSFFHEGKFYRYSCTVKDSEEIKPTPSETVRGETIYNFACLYRDSQGQLKMSVVTQCDFKIQVPSFMLTSFLPKAAKGWIDNVCKYYQKNHKKM